MTRQEAIPLLEEIAKYLNRVVAGAKAGEDYRGAHRDAQAVAYAVRELKTRGDLVGALLLARGALREAAEHLPDESEADELCAEALAKIGAIIEKEPY